MNLNSESLAVSLSDLSLSFGPSVQVLKKLNLKIPQGRIVAVIGRSGSGKTSILGIISGLLQPTAGVVQTLGYNLENKSEDELAHLRCHHIGVVFQHFYLLETMTALENVTLPLELARQKDVKPRAEKILESVGLADRKNHYPSQLSGGECQRVAIARAFVTTPKLLLADEPTGNLDDNTSDKILDVLFNLARQHQTTVLFVTHNTSILNRFDMVFELSGGVIESIR